MSGENDYADFDVEDFPGGLRACLEAVLMSAEEPQKEQDLSHFFRASTDEIHEALLALSHEYDEQNRGFELVSSVRGWRYVSRAAFEPVVAACVADKQTNRLSQAALEALAIIAYKQPVTRAQVSSIRGVSSDGVIRSLLLRGLVVEIGETAETRARFLTTTDLFLEKIGLPSVDDLPALAPFLPDRDDALDNALDDDASASEQSNDTDATEPKQAYNRYFDHL
ncbi:MAG: SMC-Scp complex subunit ScpB [Bifidobacteriaceae bacterium]|jgi:segregation and condensation protein B|nr:SMC-Scp complex subunit ScpB [Bifidobacteriaceae bacterium]MCI1978765.1 SMC-Scp complex subunit ScpB [Bifidobacteriaceae bacterium]